MIDHVRTCGLASLVLLALLVVATGCSATAPRSAPPVAVASATSAPTIVSAQPTRTAATSTPVPSARASATPIATPSALASAPPLPDGEYVSGVIKHATAVTMLKDPTIASDAGVKSFLAEFTTTAVFTLQFKNPSWVVLVHEDGQDKGIGDGGTYAFVDDHTIAMQGDSGKCNGTFGFSTHGESLKLTALTACDGAAGLAVGRVIYQSTAWTRTP
jgi:hypothetical protein